MKNEILPLTILGLDLGTYETEGARFDQTIIIIEKFFPNDFLRNDCAAKLPAECRFQCHMASGTILIHGKDGVLITKINFLDLVM